MNTSIQTLLPNQTCRIGSDNSFGPAIALNCRSFDFTLLFEQIFLSLIPSLFLILLSPIRLATVIRGEVKAVSSPIHSSKIVIAVVYAILQIVLLVLWCLSPTERTEVSISAAVLSFAGAAFICVLSHFEHVKSIRPSAIINLYLFFSVLFDAVQLRTLWMIPGLDTIAGVFSASFSAKATLLILEAVEKGPYLAPPYRWTTPEALSSVYNVSVFWWLNRLFRTGFRKVIAFEDLYTLDPNLQSEKLHVLSQASWDRVNKDTKHPLVKSTFTALKWQFLAPVFPRLCLIGFNYAQPFLINRTTRFVTEPLSLDNTNVGYGLIGATAIVYIGRAVATGRYKHATYRGMTVLRGALVSMIYSKTLKLNLVGSKDAPAVTLMSTDVGGITTSLDSLHDIWACTVEVAIGVYLLWLYAGVGFVVPLILAFVSGGINYFVIGKKMVGYRKTWNEATQKRVALAASALREIVSTRMMGLGPRIQALLQSQRVRELHRMKGLRWMIIWMNVFGGLARLYSPPFVFMVYVVRARSGRGHPLNTAQAYTILSILGLIVNPLSMVITMIPSTMSSLACFDRIQQFLLREEQADDRLLNLPVSGSPAASTSGIEMQILPPRGGLSQNEHAILLDSLSLGYSKNTNVVQSATSSLKRGTITMIVGPVGSGKTSLLLGLLGELRSNKGFIRLDAQNIGYCSQSAWLPNGTVRQIIAGTEDDLEDVDEVWLRSVIYACALDVDIELFPRGEHSLIGSRGLTLSGGQRQRLALARAVYQRQILLILDDILSALDAKTEALVFSRLFSNSGILRQQRTTIILATHAVHHMRSADHIIALGPDGSIVEQGNVAELESTDGYIKSLAIAESQKCLDQSSDLGKEEMRNLRSFTAPASIPTGDTGNDARRLGDFSVYNYYRKALSLSRLGLFVSLEIFSVSAYKLIQLLVGWWSDASGGHTNLFICAAFLLPCLALSSQVAYLRTILVSMGPLAGRRLHWILTRVVFAAPLSFFTNTDSGIILNRFSQDMTIVDIQLPIALLQTVHTTLEVLWSLVLMCYGAYYLFAFVPFLGAILYAIQNFYLRTSRQIRILDLELQSPLFSTFTETIEGLSTIRAFGWQDKLMRAFLKRLDASQRPFYLLFCIQRWLNFVMDLLVACMAVLLVSFATQLKNTTSGVAIGIGLLNVLDFGGMAAALIQYWTTLETSIGAVARLKQLEADVKPESRPQEVEKPAGGWPQGGAVTFGSVSARYASDSENVLHEIDLSIKGGEKIGICGRTGSGKSTLIGLLFRLSPEHTGTITIDDQDISLLSREEVRSSIIVIPQEPCLLSGSARFNAAPYTTKIMSEAESEEFEAPEALPTTTSRSQQPISDTSIINALKKVGLWEQIADGGDLSQSVDSIGLSHGQKQLFCLARALLRKDTSRVLVLDEATSSVDKKTDAVMRAVIEEEFQDHTVITVAHRLSSLSWCDRVVVLDKGRIVELGHPEELMKMKGGWWKQLWDAQN
ncbi:multidrug resistance-associated protein [Mollisia scopiformis]|uniref:Multidrug resistance-associated protein n=1 Tax=Mollisia scopiformis TaxID=149040 RepID=A0A194X8Q8_MOLSC|nr:multidrug resistance-associated protein [Mollisia scopiformis]KUJ16558.1 multidrug resistance-associated protein [Mollisia scopiformis]